MSTANEARLAAAGFILLLALSVVWPQPVIDLNRACCHAPLGIDDLSFLGREAPAWDVVFWCIAGLFAIALLQRGSDFSTIGTEWRNTALRLRPVALIALGVAAAIVAAVWRWVDAPMIAWSESVESGALETSIRYANRFGGGMNPVMIVGFFILAGVAFRLQRWIWYGIAMAIAGAAAGILVQVVKYAVGRTRPELWLGPFHHARASATSFPSGHTVGAFALAGVLILRSRSNALRVGAILLALAVAVSRILAFRHWPSDVIASAAIGLFCAAIVTEASSLPRARQSSRSPDASSPPLPS